MSDRETKRLQKKLHLAKRFIDELLAQNADLHKRASGTTTVLSQTDNARDGPLEAEDDESALK